MTATPNHPQIIPIEDLARPGSVRAQVLEFLRQHAPDAYAVGGFVRDHLLERGSYDLDLAVPRDGLKLAQSVADHLGGAFFPLDPERDTGRAVLHERDGAVLFVDCARLRGADLEADLRKRDFAVNALAIRLSDGRLIDPLNGIFDLQARRLRLASPQALEDDPARLLRAVRHEAELGFRLDALGEARVRSSVALIQHVAMERLREELWRILEAPRAAEHVERLRELGLLGYLLPEQVALRGVAQSPPHYLDVYEHTLQVVGWTEWLLKWVNTERADLSHGVGLQPPACLPTRQARQTNAGRSSEAEANDEFSAALWQTLQPWREPLRAHFATALAFQHDRRGWLKWGALMHDWGKPATRRVEADGRIRFLGHEAKGAELAARAAERLRFSRQEILWIRRLVEAHMRPAFLARRDQPPTSRAVYRYVRDLGPAAVDVLFLHLADLRGIHGPHLLLELWRERLEQLAPVLRAYFEQNNLPPLLDGKTLMQALDVQPGPIIGRLLERIREAQVLGEIQTTEEALELARRRLEKM